MSERLRTLFYVNRFAIANPTGIQRYAFELVEAVDALGGEFAVELCSIREPGAHPPPGIPGCEMRLPRRTTHLAWTLLHRPVIERGAGRADLLHLSHPYFPVPSRAPVVMTIHDLLPMTHPEWYPRSERVLFERSVRYHLREGAHVIAPSHSVAAEVASVLGVATDRITTVYEGVTPRFAGPLDEAAADAVCARYAVGDRPFFLALGGITDRKNLGVVFEALATLASSRAEPPQLLVVGGDRPLAAQTHASASSSAASDLITFTGRLSDDDVHALMSRAAAHVHPSMSEGFGLTTLEAMAAGTPCIASDAGALPEIVGDAGLLVDPRDPAAWAGAMAQVIDDSELSARLRSQGRRHVARFTWRTAAEETAAVYRKVLDQAR